jgi:hypothetical protein
MRTRYIIPLFSGFSPIQLDIYDVDKFVVCTHCKECISTFRVQQHLHVKHNLVTDHNTIRSLFLPLPKPFPLFMEKVANLKVCKGHICESCNFVCRSLLCMKKHIEDFHEGHGKVSRIKYQSIKNGFEEVKYQVTDNDSVIFKIAKCYRGSPKKLDFRAIKVDNEVCKNEDLITNENLEPLAAKKKVGIVNLGKYFPIQQEYDAIVHTIFFCYNTLHSLFLFFCNNFFYIFNHP